MPIKAISICEDEYGETYSFATQAEFEVFARGFTEGANTYGAGGAGVYSLACLSNMREPCDKKRMELIRQHLGTTAEATP